MQPIGGDNMEDGMKRFSVVVMASLFAATSTVLAAENLDSQKFLKAIENVKFPNFGANGFANETSVGQGARVIGMGNGQNGMKFVYFVLSNGAAGEATCLSLDVPQWICTFRPIDMAVLVAK
jgi:hypothetical protein